MAKNGTLRAMKVLILITKSNWGGAQRYVYDIATNLPKDRYEVEVMAGGNGPLIDRLRESGVRANGDLPINRDVRVTGDIKAFFKILSLLKKNKPDILHINSSKIGGMGALAGRLVGIKKIIFTAHGFAFNEDRSFISKIIIKVLHWLTIALSHKTITVSEFLGNQMSLLPLIPEKITTVHNGIKAQPIFSKINARHELGKINKDFDQIARQSTKDLIIIGSVGELHKTKGYEYALEGIKSLIENLKQKSPSKKIFYVIAGEGEYRKNIENKIELLGLNNSVLLLGNVPDVFQYLRSFDYFLIPSISEGLPYMLLEAGIAGLPIVSTAVGGIPEVVDDMKSGILIQQKKSSQISDALEFLITHKKTCSEYSKNINNRVLKDFSIEKMLEKTIRTYEE